ncbi:MAG: helix-turn-helix domain-containing protein [Candidatus Synoicihabitans palmerolidicus]|nr:helix-turn-helix domain-containing protein [Candidatus Synoicihabitans palmerolidicus]
MVAKIQRRITAKEREAIHAGLAQGKSGAQLAAALGRDASVVNREITRNGGRNSYMDAQIRACRRPKCAARNKVADTPALRDEVLTLFATGATPKQIEVALRRRHGLDLTRRVSQETIYDFIYVHSKGSVKKELIAYLRRKRSPGAVPPPAPRASSRASCRARSISASDPLRWSAGRCPDTGRPTWSWVRAITPPFWSSPNGSPAT